MSSPLSTTATARPLKERLMLLVDLFSLLATVTAEAKLSLLVHAMVVGVQTQLARLLGDFFEAELGHGVGDPPCHLPFDMGFGVDDVDLLKLTAGCFNIEEEAEDQTDKVKEREEEINTPWALASEKGCEHDHGKVADPVGTC